MKRVEFSVNILSVALLTFRFTAMINYNHRIPETHKKATEAHLIVSEHLRALAALKKEEEEKKKINTTETLHCSQYMFRSIA